MDYPLQVELDINQDDFIQVEIMEQQLESIIYKKECLKTFIYQLSALAAASLICFLAREVIAAETQYFILFFAVMFGVNFAYRYFQGYKNEFSMGVNHLLINRDKSFFEPEKGIALFYENKCEYLTNEQRRYFDYDKIQHIKQTKHLFVFVMKRSREKNMRGFAYMVIPKRSLNENQIEFLNEICTAIIEKYKLSPWIENSVMD